MRQILQIYNSGEFMLKGELESVHLIVMEITFNLLIMVNHRKKSWNCVFEFLWKPWLVRSPLEHLFYFYFL